MDAHASLHATGGRPYLRIRARNIRGAVILPLRVYLSGQKDVPEPVNAEIVEVIIGKIQLKSASEIPDAPLEFVPAQSRN